MWMVLSVYVTILLWIGVRPDHGYVRWRETLGGLGNRISSAEIGSGSDALDGWSYTSFHDVFEFVLGLVLGLILSCFGVLLFWIGVNILVIAVLLLALPVYYVFRRGLRLVLVQSPRCRHRLGRSALVAVRHALWYALCIGAPLWLVDHLIHLV